MPLVSIIIPAYNAERYIKESIYSVLQQTFSDWELIVMDDGSTDGTADIVHQYSNLDKRIRYLYQENGKQGKARNNAIRQATGQLIAFLDADDIWLENKLSVQVNALSKNGVDLVFSDAFLFEKIPVSSNNLMGAFTGLLEGANGIKKMLEINRIPILTVLATKKSLESVNFFTEVTAIQNAEDYHLWLKLLMKGYRLLGTGETLACYRVHDTASTADDKLAISKVIEAFQDLKGLFPGYRQLINVYLRKKLLAAHYSTNQWRGDSYKKLLQKTGAYLECPATAAFAVLLNIFPGRKFARKWMAATVLDKS